MQSLYEEKTIKAFLWMLISNKVFLDYEDKNNKKSKYVYYSLFNGFDKPITINEEVIQEKELDKLFAYINQNIDILNMWSKEFDKYLEKQTKEIKVNNESSKFIDSVEKYILNSSLVQILTTNIYDYIRTVKKVKAKSLIEYLYDSTIEFNNYNSLVIKVIANFIKQQIMKYLEGTEYDYSVVYKNIVKTLIAYLNNFITDIDKLSVMAKWLKKLFG